MRLNLCVMVVALIVPAAAAAEVGMVIDDNVGVLKHPTDRALEVIRLGSKHRVELGRETNGFVEVSVRVERGMDRFVVRGWMAGHHIRLQDGTMAAEQIVERMQPAPEVTMTSADFPTEAESTVDGWDQFEKTWGGETSDAGGEVEDLSFADDSTEDFFDDGDPFASFE